METVPVGAPCDGDGECGTDQYLNNCRGYDVYRRVACPAGAAMAGASSSSSSAGAFAGNPMIGSVPHAHPAALDGMAEWNHAPMQPGDEDPIATSTTLPTNAPSAGPADPVGADGCPYYPGWNLGLSHCLRDCRQPAYMRSNSIFEFDAADACCE